MGKFSLKMPFEQFCIC